MNIPEIATAIHNGQHRATFGLQLAAIQHESARGAIPEPGAQPVDSWRIAHQRNVMLLRLLSGWPHLFSVELNYVSYPSLDREIPGRNQISLLFHVQADTALSATELALADSVRLGAALESLWPSAEFVSLGQHRLTQGCPWFTPQSCLLIGHRDQMISPTHPLSPGRLPIGFQAPDALQGIRLSSDTTLRHVYPWVPPAGEDLSAMLETLLNLPTPRWILVRVGNNVEESRRLACDRLKSAVDACERYLAGNEQGQLALTAQARTIRDASMNRCGLLSAGALVGSVLVFGPGRPDYVTASLVGQSITEDPGCRQVDSVLEGGFAVRSVDAAEAQDAFRFFEDEPLTTEEAAGALRLPLITDHRDLGLPVRRYRTLSLDVPAGSSDSTECIRFGVNIHRSVSRPVNIHLSDRLRHTLIIGATGVGKSTMLLSAMLQDARAGRGLALIDPAGDLADEFLSRFPAERVQDLTIVNFDDREFPVPLNLLSWSSVEERDLLIDTLYSTLLAIYRNPDFFGPIFENHFRSGLRLLLGEHPRVDFIPTLLEIPQVFRRPEFRKYLKTTTEDEEVIGAIEEADRVSYGDNTLSNIAPYINAKFARFLHDSQLRRIVGHGGMALDFKSIMDQGQIVVFKLAQGRVGKHVSDVLIAQLVSRFRLAAMSRSDVANSLRREFMLYCDEFQVIADENFAQMVSQCRKHKLGLILVHQYATQLRDHGVLEAVLANVGTIVAYRLGAEDARLLEPVFAPSITARDLIQCPNFEGYARLYSNVAPARPFSFRNIPESTAPNAAWAQELLELSRRRWGVHADEIDRRIKERRRFINGLPESARSRTPIQPSTPATREDVAVEDIRLTIDITALSAKLEAEKPQWRKHRDRSASMLRSDVHQALMTPFLFFLPVELDWFLALAKSLMSRGELSESDFSAFVGTVLEDARVSSSSRERLAAAMRAFKTSKRAGLK